MKMGMMMAPTPGVERKKNHILILKVVLWNTETEKKRKRAYKKLFIFLNTESPGPDKKMVPV